MSQDSSPPSAAIRRVPVFETMRTAYVAVFSSLGPLVKAAALPFLLSLAIIALSLTMTTTNAFLSFILTFVGFVPYTLFGVAWHRLTLLGPAEGAPVTFPSWRRRHWRFLSYVAIMTGAIYLISFPFVLAGVRFFGDGTQGVVLIVLLLAMAVILLLPYVMMRFSFVFPAAAVDEEYTLAHSWAHTRGQGLRLMATLFVTALPMLAVIGIMGSLFLPDLSASSQDTGMSPEEALSQYITDNAVSFSLVQLALAALNYIVMALMVSAVSIAFRLCTGWVPAAAGLPATPQADDKTDEGS